MPNWVRNIVTTSEETINKIKEKYFQDGELRFNKIIPMPQSLDITSGTTTEKAILYVISKSEPQKMDKLIKILENANQDYWARLAKNFTVNDIANLENYAKEYVPTAEEQSHGINSLDDLGNIAFSNIENYGVVDWYNWCIENWGTKWEPSEISYNKNTLIFETAWATPEPIFEKLSEEFPDDYIEVKYADECYSNYNNGMMTFKDGLVEYAIELDEEFAASVWAEEIDENISDSKDITEDMFD